MLQPFGLTLDLLTYQVHGKIRSTLLSSRNVVTPTSGTITNVQRTIAAGASLVVPLTSVLSALVVKSSAEVKLDMVVSRTALPDVVLPQIHSSGITVITDTVKSVTITNSSAVAPVDISIVSI